MVNVPGVSCSGVPSHAFWEGTGKGSYMDDINENLSQKAVFGCCHDPHTVIKKKKSSQIDRAWGSICCIFIIFSKSLTKIFLV